MPNLTGIYRQKRKWPYRAIVSLAVTVAGLAVTAIAANRQKLFLLWSEATGTEASLVVKTQTLLPGAGRPWAHLAQGGEDLSGNMIAPVVSQIKILSPQTIRIDHIYDGYDVVGRDGSGQLTFNFSRLDEVVSSIRQTGAVPMLSLSYMPAAISVGDIVDKPRDWNEWAAVVQRTIEHYSGSLNITNMTYEVWNEPDLFGGWKTHGDKNYLALYEWAAIGAGRAKVNQSFLFGGPATTGAYQDWTRKLLDLAAQKNLRLDFLSWHRYSLNLKTYEDDRTMVRRILNQYPKFSGVTQLYITEFGPNSETNSVNDSGLAAAHLAAAVAEGGGEIDRYYTFEIVDGKDPAGKKLWGRWGLLTHPDAGLEIKPRYRGLQMLNRLEGEQLAVAGEGSWVKAMATKSADGVIRVVTVNYDQYGRHMETTPLVFAGLMPGGYQAARTLLSGRTRTEMVSAGTDGGLRLLLELPPQTVMLVELSPAR